MQPVPSVDITEVDVWNIIFNPGKGLFGFLFSIGVGWLYHAHRHFQLRSLHGIAYLEASG